MDDCFNVECISTNTHYFTVGEIYHVSFGTLYGNSGYKARNTLELIEKPFTSVEQINRNLVAQFKLVESN